MLKKEMKKFPIPMKKMLDNLTFENVLSEVKYVFICKIFQVM